jgi:hypothetical protein
VQGCRQRGGHALGDEQQVTHRESSDSSADRIRAERTRACEIRHLLSKLSLCAEQAEIIEGFSRSLVEEIIRGPIAKTVALSRAPSEPVANVETLHAQEEAERDRRESQESTKEGNTLSVGQGSSRRVVGARHAAHVLWEEPQATEELVHSSCEEYLGKEFGDEHHRNGR